MTLEKIEIWADGGCIVAKGIGAWAYRIKYLDSTGCNISQHSQSGMSVGTTNNQMELMAILEAFREVVMPTPMCPITVYSDSQWAVRCLKKEYDCKARVVSDYLREIEKIVKSEGWQVEYVDVPGHAGVPDNEDVHKEVERVMRKMEASSS